MFCFEYELDDIHEICKRWVHIEGDRWKVERVNDVRRCVEDNDEIGYMGSVCIVMPTISLDDTYLYVITTTTDLLYIYILVLIFDFVYILSSCISK